jgi:uncharacterized protein (DUF2236 family)
VPKDSLKTSPGLFSPASTFWRVNRELVLGVAGSRALLMQLAHPLIAAGVADHSNFRQHRFARLYRTAQAMADITFGSVSEACQAARHMQYCHRRVTGTLRENAGPYSAGTQYDANDPCLKLWVLATIIDSSLLVYSGFVGPLTLAEREGYIRESQVLARWLGVPKEIMPKSYPDFVAYVERMLTSNVLTISRTARELCEALFGPPLTRSLGLVGIGLLPQQLRDEYGFRWSDRHEQLLRQLAKLSRQVRVFLPDILCVSPKAWVAEWRASQGRLIS